MQDQLQSIPDMIYHPYPKNSISCQGPEVNENLVKSRLLGLINYLIRILKLRELRGDIQLYVKRVYDLGCVKEVAKYYPGNYGAPGKKRGKKRRRTPEDIERQNKTNREKKIQRLILANFHEGDWHLILTYMKDKRPGSFAEAKQQIQKFLAEMRKAYKKAGYAFKYIYVTERGKQGACHHHLIIEDIADQKLNTKKMVLKNWQYGSKNFIPLYEDGEFENLAEYIVKKETKEEQEGCTYSRSRNLIVPEPKREIIHRRRWRNDPKPEKGWYIVPDSLVNGENPVTGYPYQHYTMRKLDPGGDDG